MPFLAHAQKHRDERKNAYENQNNGDSRNRSVPAVTDAGDRFVFVTPEISNHPSVLPERNNQCNCAGSDECQTQNPRRAWIIRRLNPGCY